VDFPEILERWSPQRASEKTLLAAYFLNRFRRQPTLTSQRINAILKQHGLTVSNITRAIETNLRASPPLMEQIRKRGTTRQARKEYLLTDAGERIVEERLRTGS
jgi:predicted transcriptional regulator